MASPATVTSHVLPKRGQTIEKRALLQAWAEAGSLFDERERAALAWAETVTRVAETGVPDEAYAAALMGSRSANSSISRSLSA